MREYKFMRKTSENIFIPTIENLRYNIRYISMMRKNYCCYFDNKFVPVYTTSEIKVFYTFAFIGDEFPKIVRYKEIMPELKKYKFCKIQILGRDTIRNYYFKRGVLFDENQQLVTDNKEFLQLKRFLKLSKINNLQD